jgi:hypothetical protein
MAPHHPTVNNTKTASRTGGTTDKQKLPIDAPARAILATATQNANISIRKLKSQAKFYDILPDTSHTL